MSKAVETTQDDIDAYEFQKEMRKTHPSFWCSTQGYLDLMALSKQLEEDEERFWYSKYNESTDSP